MDNAFSSSYNSFAKNNNIDKDNFVASLNTARTSALKNAFMRVKEQPREYKNLYYEAQKAKFVYDNVAQIYAGSEDPRESANAHYAAELITKLYPSIPEDIAEDSYRPLIKSITGDDMDAKTLFGVAWKTAKNVWNSFRLGGKVYLYSTAGKLFQEGLPDEIEANRDKEFRNAYDIFKQEKGLNQRVDYYDKDYNSFLEKVVLDAAEIIPSEILSFGPEVFGAVLSAVTRNPIFYSGARQFSKFTSAFMEAGSSAQELYEAGADWDTIRAVANTVGLINGSLEIIGNIPERGINERLFNMKALREAVGDTGTELTRGLASTVFANKLSNYALGLITEPATEVAQEFVSMYAMNLASKWQERNKGKAFEDQFTYTPEEMAEAMKEIAVSTFRGQLLLGLVGEGFDVYTSLRKGGQFLYNAEKKTGFNWEMGDLRKIIETRKYQDIAGSSVLVPKGMVDVNDTVKSYAPSEVDDKNRPKEKLTPVKARNIGGEYVPINDAEMAKAKYMSENSEYGMYIEVVNDGNVDKEAMSAEGLRRIINSLPDEINKHQVDYSYTDNGDIVIGDKAELGAIVAGFVSANISRVENVAQTDNGYTVTVNGKNVNFTTDATDATEFNQADYVREAKATADSQPKEMSEEWKKRVEDIRSRAENEALIKKNIKTRDFNREVSKVIDSRIADKDARKDEKAKIDEKVNTISAEYEKAMKASVERFPNSEFTKMLSGRNISDVATSLARATVMASAKMAQSMDTNISDFMNRVNFMFSPESMKEGKERAGWTTVNPDGTFDVNVTSFFDQTTGIHEMGHVYLSMIGDNYKSIEGFEKQFAKELEADGGKIGRNTQEAFAEALEAYVNEGLAKSEGLRRVFDLVLDALRNFVNSVRELLSPEKVAMFDNLFEKGIKGYNPELANTNDGTFYAKDVDADVEFQRQYDDVVAKYKDTDQWLKAPNGKDSNLDERLWVTVRTDNFKRWFGDWENDPENASKVVDENGEPLVVYHGTNWDFNDINSAFNEEAVGNNFRLGMALNPALYDYNFFFITSEEYAKRYGKNVVKAFLNVRTPEVADIFTQKRNSASISEALVTAHDYGLDYNDTTYGGDYDGAIVRAFKYDKQSLRDAEKEFKEKLNGMKKANKERLNEINSKLSELNKARYELIDKKNALFDTAISKAEEKLTERAKEMGYELDEGQIHSLAVNRLSFTEEEQNALNEIGDEINSISSEYDELLREYDKLTGGSLDVDYSDVKKIYSGDMMIACNQPNQIKSTDNSGRFSDADSIYYKNADEFAGKTEEEISNKVIDDVTDEIVREADDLLNNIQSFKFTQRPDGTLVVKGDKDTIKRLYPDGGKWSEKNGTMTYVPSKAKDAYNALSGGSEFVSRGGAVTSRYQYENDGTITGAPKAYNTARKIAGKLRPLLVQLMNEGEAGRYWYERSSEAILKAVGGDIEEAKKLVSAIAILSPQSKVDANTTTAVKAWMQYKAGVPINVKTAKQNEQLNNRLYRNLEWGGEKTNNFSINLRRLIDKSADEMGATVDMWVMRAFGYDTDHPSNAQYRFAENEINKIAQDAGWEPQQVQAAIWVALKARTEDKAVKTETEAKSLAKGYMRYDVDADGKKKRVVINEGEHRKLWLKTALAKDISEISNKDAKFDFSDGLKRLMGQVSVEVAPSFSSGILEGYYDAPVQVQAQFMHDVFNIFLDENGNDELNKLCGLLYLGAIDAPGVYNGDISLGIQQLVAIPRYTVEDKYSPYNGQQLVTDEARQALEMKCALLGYFLRQECVGWNVALKAKNKTLANALSVDLKELRPLTNDEAVSLCDAINKVGEKYELTADGVIMVSTAKGIMLVNGTIDNEYYKGKPIQNSEFDDIMEEALDEWEADVKYDAYRIFDHHGVVKNDWGKQRYGEGYKAWFGERGLLDVFRTAEDRYSEVCQRLYERYAEKYGWGEAGNLLKDYTPLEERFKQEIKELADASNSPVNNDNPNMLFKDADDYNNDYHYNFERAVEAKKSNDEETLTKLRAIRDAFRNGLLEAVKDEYFDGVDIVVFNPENVSADFLDGTEASEFVWKLLEDPLVTTYNSREGTEATIHLPSGDDLHLFISARTDNEDFIEYRDSFISNKLMNNDEDEQKTNSYETFVSDAFSDVERNLTGGLHRITYNGGTSRYGAPNYSQSMDYAFSGEGFAEFGVGMYDTSIKDIAKGYAHSIANMKKFRNGEKNLDRIVHTNIISGDDNNFMSWEEPVTMELYHDVVRTLNEMHYNLDDVSIDTSSGENLYRSLADAFNDDAMATQVLKEAGLEGLRYNTDSIFEGKGDGVNYVVFDDAFVRTIMEESYTDSGVRIDSTRFKRPEFMLYKDADISMNEKELADALNDGRFVPNEVLDMYSDNPLVKMERLVQNIVGTKPEWFKLYKRSVDEYLKETGHTFEDFDKWDYKKILDDWNKRLKGANQYMEIPSTDGDYVLMMRRLNAYASMESPEKAETAWMDRLNHTRYGRENIRELAVEMKKKGMFGDTLEGYDLSARYPALSLIAEKTESAEKRGVRPRIDVAVYDSAKDEAFRNRQAIREELNDSNTNNYESNMSETDTNTNYMESADIKEILDEKGVSGEIKDIVRNGIWDGTVVRDLMDKASETLKQLNMANSTLDLTQRKLDIERERIKLYEQEIKQSEKNKAKVKRLRQLLSETQNRANSLELAYSALADLYATEKLQSALYKTQRQITDIVNSRSGEADTNRAIRDAVKTIMKFTRENRVKNPALKGVIYLDEMKGSVDDEGKEIKGKAPALAEFLEDAKIVDKDGNLLKGIDGMNVSELNAFKKAIKADKDGSKDRQKQKERDFDTNTMNLASKIVSSMRPKNIDKVMTPEDRKSMRDEIAEQTEGITSKAEKDRIAEEVRSKTIAKVIQDIADGARYGIEAHSEAINKKRVVDDFTTLSRLLEAVSPELRKFVMNGLNKATDGKYRNVDKRMARFYSNIKEMYKLSSDKKLKEFLNSFVNNRMELKRATFNQIPTRLKANELFMKMWEADEKSGDNKKQSKFQYSIQDMMAIYEHSKEWDGLRHLKGNGIHASEIAWVVREFESENGSLEYYRKAADEIQRVYGERFPELYDTVLDVENRETVKVSSYSPMFGIGLNKDLMLKFGELFNDDRKAQASWFTKDRQFGTNPIDLNYYSRLEKVVEMQEAYINGAGFYRQLDHLMSEDGGNLRNIITEVYGEPQYKRIEEILDLTKSDSVRNIISEADNMASKVRNHYVMARLAYNLSSVFQQVGSFFLGLSKYNVVDLWKSSMQFILHPIEMSNRVYELSPQMKHAVNPLIRMAYETGKADPKTVGGKIDKFVASIGEKGLVLMEKQDHIIRNILWWTSYQKELANAQKAKAKELASQGITSPTAEQLSLTDDEQEQCQINATQWVLDIQSSSQAKDNSRLYAGGGLFWKNILMFTNQLNKEWNMLYVDGIKEGLFKKDFGKFFANFAALGLATMWVVACTGKIKNDEDDDETWAEDLLKDWGIEFTSRVPLVGNLTKNVYEGFAYRQSDDIVTRLTQAVLALTNEKAKPSSKVTALKNVGWSALDLAGAPTTFIKRTTQAFEDGEIFEADHFMRFFGGEWYKYFE